MNDTRKLLTMHEMQQEHQDLNDKIDSLKEWWKDVSELGVPHFYEMGCMLKELRDSLAIHIEHEVEQSFLTPELSEKIGDQNLVNRIRDEHDTLLQQLDEIIQGLQQTEPDFDSWDEPREKLEAFLTALHKHEQCENAIMREAYADSME